MPTDDDLDPTEFDKIIGQFKLQLYGLLRPLRLYGQGEVVEAVVEQLESLGVQLHLKLSGVDIPYEFEKTRFHDPEWI